MNEKAAFSRRIVDEGRGNGRRECDDRKRGREREGEPEQSERLGSARCMQPGLE